MQVAAARVILAVGGPGDFSMPQHSFEYLNTLRWFYDTFDHPLRLRLLYVAGSFVNQAAWWVQNSPGTGTADRRPPKGSSSLSQHDILRRLDQAMIALKPAESVAWTQAYLKGGYDRQPLVQTLALGAVKRAMIPTTRKLLSAYSRTTCTVLPPSAMYYCWPVASTLPVMRNTVIHSNAIDASPRPSVSSSAAMTYNAVPEL